MSDLCLPIGENCPKCGAEFKCSYPGWNVYVCQTIQRTDDGKIKEQEPCLRRQNAQKDAKIADLEAHIEELTALHVNLLHDVALDPEHAARSLAEENEQARARIADLKLHIEVLSNRGDVLYEIVEAHRMKLPPDVFKDRPLTAWTEAVILAAITLTEAALEAAAKEEG